MTNPNRSRHGRRTTRADVVARALLAPLVAAGSAVCWRCRQPIAPDDDWDAGHLDDVALGGDPNGPRQPEHSACNRAAGARLSKVLRRRRRMRPAVFLNGQ